ncbi:hypothetical protein EIP91_009651 [Steccherinum ochraceum]|uniref:Yeast cell wall synthesis Kre9/Knh1-like N-terminal domain-containing protein n=1 Tax=Steccherinum ochraceum TaxID=92696 RepID=A0A4R0RAS1_9APHY|nr:hypothetical protein EIP91_009651 [Steccherinum ochraceum]
MRFATLATALVSATAVAAIDITGPSASSYWVQMTTNNITWNFGSSDPNPVSIIVTNANDTFLNGPFSIAEFVDLSPKSFQVTNVTLKEADGYQVLFVNPTNHSQTYATSNTFGVKAPGTSPAPQAASSNTTSSSASGSTASSTAPSSTGSNAPTTAANNSGAVQISAGVFGVVTCAGIAGISALLL